MGVVSALPFALAAVFAVVGTWGHWQAWTHGSVGYVGVYLGGYLAALAFVVAGAFSAFGAPA